MIIKTININSVGKVTVGGWIDEEDRKGYPNGEVEMQIQGVDFDKGIDADLNTADIVALAKLLQALFDKHAEPDPSTWYDVENL